MAFMSCVHVLILVAALVFGSNPTPVLSLNVHRGIANSSYIYVNRKVLLSSSQEALSNAAKGVVFDLMHRDHVSSPLHNASLTMKERLQKASIRSQQRANTILATMGASVSTQTTYQETVQSGSGSYLMTINLGTPGQMKVAIVDTGSDLIWLQCDPCTSCYSQPDPYFNPSSSSTYGRIACTSALCTSSAGLPRHTCVNSQCGYSYSYGDQSTTVGDFSRETITLTTTTGQTRRVANLAFGCGHQNRGTFAETDGLVGLGQGRISFASQLGFLFGDKFSYCLVTFGSASTRTSKLLFGDDSVPASPNLMYTPLISSVVNPSFYYLTLNGISVGGQLLNIPDGAFDMNASGTGGVILDSGTTITELVMSAYIPFLNAVESLISYPIVSGTQQSIGLDLCYDVTNIMEPEVPTVTFHFANVDVNLPGNNIFIFAEQDVICLAFGGFSGFTIYGNIQQQNYRIVYDRLNKQIGFLPVSC